MKHKLSVVLITYNQENFVTDAISSLIKQDLDELEIIVVDDCSSDRTYEILQKILASYQGKKHIKLFRNKKNKGVVGNLNYAFQQTSGDLIYIAGGDDISEPNRCRRCYEFWLENGSQHDLVASDGFDMSVEGVDLGIKATDELQNWTLQKWHQERRPFFFGASQMVTKQLIEMDVLNTELQVEDQVLVHRALMRGGALRLPEPLVHHRRGGLSQMDPKIKNKPRIQRFKDDSYNNLIELQQFYTDSKKLGRVEELRILTKEKYLTEKFIYAILTASKLTSKIWILLSSTDISFSRRLKYFKYSVFYRRQWTN